MASSSPLALDDYRRYGRQMILEGIGLEGQVKLHNASIAIVGAGGLGCPAIQYLAAAGVGRLGIIDHDRVELSNLQRQVLHTENRLHVFKAESAAVAVAQLNSKIATDVITQPLTAENALDLLQSYDLFLDCTDNAPTRYLLSDTAVRLGKPLVSGAAQRFDGQLCTYNLANSGPCYRCLFPTPPHPTAAPTCEETGIMGAITGIIGSLQALEAIKIITGLHDGTPSLLLYSALSMPPFRSVKLRPRRAQCAACGSNPKRLSIREVDYVQFCGGLPPDWTTAGIAAGAIGHRIRPLDLQNFLKESHEQVRVLDVRPATEFGICHLPNSINVSLKEILAHPSDFKPDRDTFIVCRLGNDSQLAAAALRGVAGEHVVQDLVGGLVSWAAQADSTFPVY